MNKQDAKFNETLITNMSIGHISRGFTSMIQGVTFSDDGSLLAAYTNDTLYLYDVSTAKKVKILQNKVNQIAHLKFTHNNQGVIYAPKFGPYNLYYWSLTDNEIIKCYRVMAVKEIRAIVINPLKDTVLTYTDCNCLRVYNITGNSGDPLLKMDQGNKVNKLTATFNSTGTILAIACNFYHQSEDRNVNRVELNDLEKQNNTRLLGYFINEDAAIEEMHYINNNSRLVFILESGKILITEANNGNTIRCIQLFGVKDGLKPSISFSIENRFMVVGRIDNITRLFDMETGNEIGRYIGHLRHCYSVCFSPYHAIVVTGGENLIWWVPKYWC